MQDFEDLDFGIDFSQDLDSLEIDAETQQNAANRVKVLENAIESLYTKIVPLLEQLTQNPEKQVIKWPDRARQARQFLDELSAIYETATSDQQPPKG